jgi:hypothetical protein
LDFCLLPLKILADAHDLPTQVENTKTEQVPTDDEWKSILIVAKVGLSNIVQVPRLEIWIQYNRGVGAGLL